jgi:hypothetical protein
MQLIMGFVENIRRNNRLITCLTLVCRISCFIECNAVLSEKIIFPTSTLKPCHKINFLCSTGTSYSLELHFPYYL